MNEKANMADNAKPGILNSAGKALRRQRTKVMQSLGKTAKTTDDILSEDCQKLEKQQEVATRFQKDLRSYIQSARGLSVASKTLYHTLSETYEAEWEGQESVVEILNNINMLWQDYIQKLQDHVQDRLTKYLACIPQIKSRVAKSRRKLIDYDNAKHNLEVQENAKKKDEAKIAKAKEDLEHAKKIYEDLNNDLHQELPEFYKSRCTFYGDVFRELFEAETRLYTESGKGTERIAQAAAKLSADNSQFTYTPRKNLRNTIIIDKDIDITNGHNQSSTDIETPSTSPATSPATSPTSNEPVVNGEIDSSKDSFDDSTYDNAEIKPEPVVDANKASNIEEAKASVENTVQDKLDDVKQEEAESEKLVEKVEEVKQEVKDEVNQVKDEVKEEVKEQMNGDVNETEDLDVPAVAPPPVPASPPPEEQKVEDKGNDDTKKEDNKEDGKKGEEEENGVDEDLYEVPPPAVPVDNFMPKNCLYTVQATHNYQGEDDDELCFKAHEIIYVIPYDDPEEQDPGWLMGMRQSDQKCGVFPENFTKQVKTQD